jgi:regulatory protein
MKVSAIQQQIKREDRYSVFIDGEYAFSLSADAVLETGITKGLELSQVELTAYKKLSQDDKAYALTIAYVARRMRSRGELCDYFRRKGYDEDVQRTVLLKLERQGLVDDYEFARRWVENRRLLKSSSTAKLRMELRQKHVTDEIVGAVLAEDSTDERQMVRELVVKKRRQTRYQDDQKLLAYLARQGFSYDDIKAAMSADLP